MGVSFGACFMVMPFPLTAALVGLEMYMRCLNHYDIFRTRGTTLSIIK